MLDVNCVFDNTEFAQQLVMALDPDAKFVHQIAAAKWALGVLGIAIGLSVEIDDFFQRLRCCRVLVESSHGKRGKAANRTTLGGLWKGVFNGCYSGHSFLVPRGKALTPSIVPLRHSTKAKCHALGECDLHSLLPNGIKQIEQQDNADAAGRAQ